MKRSIGRESYDQWPIVIHSHDFIGTTHMVGKASECIQGRVFQFTSFFLMRTTRGGLENFWQRHRHGPNDSKFLTREVDDDVTLSMLADVVVQTVGTFA